MSHASAHHQRSPARTNAPVGEPRTSILVVTDDEALSRACTTALQQAGYDVTWASHSGHALLQCLRGNRADVLLTELSLPDGSGVALARRLRRYQPGLQALYFANHGTFFDEGNVLVRPFSRHDLVARVRASLTSSQAS